MLSLSFSQFTTLAAVYYFTSIIRHTCNIYDNICFKKTVFVSKPELAFDFMSGLQNQYLVRATQRGGMTLSTTMTSLN